VEVKRGSVGEKGNRQGGHRERGERTMKIRQKRCRRKNTEILGGVPTGKEGGGGRVVGKHGMGGKEGKCPEDLCENVLGEKEQKKMGRREGAGCQKGDPGVKVEIHVAQERWGEEQRGVSGRCGPDRQITTKTENPSDVTGE